ncbi:hypothetical protein [Sutcliffiella cohnii]|uniref:hypothetical protein n=1 Tax=Sutcliffiella cohnii TaxID=33932 RepID=UPI0008314157|nr:hypothetical protein [Sutcliffiella cohnii]
METFQLKARTLERKFQRKLKKCNYFYTITGKMNRVIEYDKMFIKFVTERNGGVLHITRNKLRKAISYVYFKRTVIRKELEYYTSYSSAIFGLLFEIFSGLCRVQRMSSGHYRLTLNSIRFFYSGLCRAKNDMETIASNGGKFVLLSYYNIRHQKNEQWLRYLKKYNLRAIIDSGAYSVFEAIEKKKKEKQQQMELFSEGEVPYISIESYAAFINKYKDNSNIMGFLNLDVIGDPISTKCNYKTLKSLTDTEIIPVWQVNDSYEELRKLTRNDPSLLCIGGCVPLLLSNQKEKVREILKKVFEICKNVPIHGLGIANDLLLEFPFFSSDSIAWVNARKNRSRKLYLANGEKVNAPSKMSMEQILIQNIRYFASLEEKYDKTQLEFELGFC